MPLWLALFPFISKYYQKRAKGVERQANYEEIDEKTQIQNNLAVVLTQISRGKGTETNLQH